MEMFLAILSTISLVASQGYHNEIGIPAALGIYLAETTAAPNDSRVYWNANLAAHCYLVGVVISMGDSYSVCGSSLLTSSRALTAAHCWWDGWRQAEEFTMVFASEYIFVGGIRKQTKEVRMHPKWDPTSLFNDLAMITFDPVEYSQYIQPIALPVNLQNVNFIGYWAQASGYGKVIPGSLGFQQNQMQSVVDMQVVPTEQCVSSGHQLSQRTLCARGTRSNNCITHSGGPLTTVHYNERYLVGVASFGDYNCTSGTPFGFVRVTFYLKWIFMNLG